MSVARIRFAAAVMTCFGAAVAIGACGGSGDKQSEEKVEAQQFLEQLDTAVRQGNIEFRVARLHPAVIDRYGEQQCRDFLSGRPPDSTRRNRVKRVGKPVAFEYDTDNISVTIPNAIPVAVRETRMGKKADRDLHLVRVNGALTYFVDCGAPLVRQ